ncbi:MAG: QueT transporter family protein, partial [Anaerovoracaceae bacterium]
MKTKYVMQAALMAAIYAVLTIILAPISYGPLQLRVSEALTILPALTPAGVPGLFIGCLVSNL